MDDAHNVMWLPESSTYHPSCFVVASVNDGLHGESRRLYLPMYCCRSIGGHVAMDTRYRVASPSRSVGERERIRIALLSCSVRVSKTVGAVQDIS